MGTVPENELAVSAEIFKATEAHTQNKDGMFHFGTSQLNFHKNYEVRSRYVVQFKGHVSLMRMVVSGDPVNNATYRRYWNTEYDPHKYKSFPTLLTALSIECGGYGVNPEFLSPLRFCFDGDAVFCRNMPTSVRDACAFCLAHPDSDSCFKYKTPIERHERIRDVNYSLQRLRAFQICTGCFEREYKHEGWEQCEKRQSCSYCTTPGHHRSLCTSYLHHLALATKFAELDQKKLGKNVTDNGIRIASYLADWYKMDQDRTREVQLELERRKKLISDDIKDDFAFNFFDRLRMADSHKDVVEMHDSSQSTANCFHSSYLDVHSTSPLSGHIAEVMDALRKFTCTEDLDRTAFQQLITKIVTKVHQMFACSNHCKQKQPAKFFCHCGELKLCYFCVVGSAQGVREIVSPFMRKCIKCRTVIPVPRLRAREERCAYLETVAMLKRQMLNLNGSIGNFARTIGRLPDLRVWRDDVWPPLFNVFALLQCQNCGFDMNHVSRAPQIKLCMCSHVMCRSCVVFQHFHESVDHSSQPFCSEEILRTPITCFTCREKIPFYGTCAAFAVVAYIVSYLDSRLTCKNELSLADYWNNWVVARENASHQRFLINDAFEKRIAREEDEIRIREQLRLAGDVAHAGLVVDDEEDMLSKALAEEAEKDAKFDQEKKVRSEDIARELKPVIVPRPSTLFERNKAAAEIQVCQDIMRPRVSRMSIENNTPRMFPVSFQPARTVDRSNSAMNTSFGFSKYDKKSCDADGTTQK